jgi:hypothetical protein
MTTEEDTDKIVCNREKITIRKDGEIFWKEIHLACHSKEE